MNVVNFGEISSSSLVASGLLPGVVSAAKHLFASEHHLSLLESESSKTTAVSLMMGRGSSIK
jgi:hypothetical protein